MLLKVLTWNINFMHDNWSKRLNNVNRILQHEIKHCDVLVLQEVVLPFSDTISDIYKFLKFPLVKYFSHRLFFEEENYLYDKIKTVFPKRASTIRRILEYWMDKLLLICGYVTSRYGILLQKIYFTYPLLGLILFMLCPFIFIGSLLFSGMITVTNKKITGVVSGKFIGRAFQYTEFQYNYKEVIVVNIHLNEGIHEVKRLADIQQIHQFIETKNKDIIILAGDFNTVPNSQTYTFLNKNGYRSCVRVMQQEDKATFPSNNPTSCLDYIWIKGGDVDIVKAKIFGTSSATDHKGIKVVLDIK